MNPPYPLEITASEPPLPLGISNDRPWGGGGYGYFLEPHITADLYCVQRPDKPRQNCLMFQNKHAIIYFLVQVYTLFVAFGAGI